MSQQDLLRRVVEALNHSRIDYMLTGSFVSSLQGEPRSTHDIDVVVSIAQADLPALLREFPRPHFYFDEAAAAEAVRTDGMFNVIEADEGDKVDFWLLTDDPFDQSRFSRKYAEELFGIPINVSRAEDTILQKLRWVTLTGGSEKYFRDALRVYEVQAGGVDRAYLLEWVEKLSLTELWQRIEAEAELL